MQRGVVSAGPVRALIVVLGIGLVGLIPVRHAPADIPGSATLAASASHLSFGESVELAGRVEAGSECSSARTVQLLRRTAGADPWEPIDSTTSVLDGNFAFALLPPHTAGYEALIPGRDGDVACAEITSPIVSVIVSASVTLAPGSLSVSAGECATLTVSVSPDKTGQAVWIQRRRSWGWQRIQTAALGEGSVVVARPCFRWGDMGTLSLRARWPRQDQLNEAGTSSPIALRIVKARWMRRIDRLTAGIRMSVSVREAGAYLYERRDQAIRVPATTENFLLSLPVLVRLSAERRPARRDGPGYDG